MQPSPSPVGRRGACCPIGFRVRLCDKNSPEEGERRWGTEPSHCYCTHLDGLPEEALPQDLPVDQVTRPEDLLRVAAGTAQGFRAADVPAEQQGLLWGTRARRLGDAVTPSKEEGRWQ